MRKTGFAASGITVHPNFSRKFHGSEEEGEERMMRMMRPEQRDREQRDEFDLYSQRKGKALKSYHKFNESERLCKEYDQIN